MSAPLVVNTVEGTVWTRRPVTRDGAVLYAPAAIAECPEFVMATYAELEGHGIAGSADALPVPVGPEPRDVEEELTGANLSLWEEEQDNARLRLALASAKRGRSRLRARVAELETAATPLIVDADGAEPVPLRWGLNDVMWGDDDSVTVMLSGPNGEPYWLELEDTQAAVLRDDLAGPDGPGVWRAAWDTDQVGPLCSREEAARAYCEHDARPDYPDGTELAWRVYEEQVAELVTVTDGEELRTGYTVTRLPLAPEYVEEASE